MLGFIGGLLRVIIGLVMASLAAGVVQVLFAITPAELVDVGLEYWTQGSVWVLESATIIGIFAAPFGLLSALISEWAGIRSFAYHGAVGIAIAVAGFALISTGESPDAPTIVNSYAMAAFLTTGLVAGFVYWLFAGRFAYRPAKAPVASPPKQPKKPSIASPAAAPNPPPPPQRKPASKAPEGPAGAVAQSTKPKTGDDKTGDDKPADDAGTVPKKPVRTFDA